MTQTKGRHDISFVVLFFIIIVLSCSNSKENFFVVKPEKVEYNTDCIELGDTLIKKVSIIFEIGFNDTVQISTNSNILLWKKLITTIPNLGVCIDQFDYDYSKNAEEIILRFAYGGIKKNAVLKVNKSVRYIYVDIQNNEWHFTGLNCLRQYR